MIPIPPTEKYFFSAALRDKRRSEFNIISYILTAVATTGMLMLSLLFYGTAWFRFTMIQFMFGTIGYILVQTYSNRRWWPPFPMKMKYSEIHPDHVYTALSVYIIILLLQIIGGVIRMFFSPTNIAEIMYTVFSAVTEELFFRGAVLGLFIYIARGQKKHIMFAGTIISSGLAVSASLFMGYHVNYYHDPILLVIVFVGGLALGYSYVKTGDIMTPMLAHFLLNLSVAIQSVLLW